MKRRPFLKRVCVLVGGAAVIPGSAAATGNPDDLIQVGENELDLDDEDATPGVKVYVAPGPAGGRGDHRRVTLITSEGAESTDYATSIIAVDDTPFSEIREITYDYYAGANNQNAAPDEFWMLVEDEAGNEHVIFDTLNLHTDDEAWHTANPLTEGHLSHPNWKKLRDDGTVGSYTASDTDVVKRIGVGRGSTRTPRVSEVYYDNPRINGEGVGEFPANGQKGMGRGGQQGRGKGSKGKGSMSKGSKGNPASSNSLPPGLESLPPGLKQLIKAHLPSFLT